MVGVACSTPDLLISTGTGLSRGQKAAPFHLNQQWVVSDGLAGVGGFEIGDAEAAALEGGLRGWLFGVAVVVASLFGCVGNEERGGGEPGGGGASAAVSPRSWCGGLFWWRCPGDHGTSGWCGRVSGRKLHAPAPAASTSAGVVSLLSS